MVKNVVAKSWDLPIVSGRRYSDPNKQPGPAPSWFSAMANLTWERVAGGTGFGSAYQNGSRITDVQPSPQPPGAEGIAAVMNDWTGAAVFQSQKWYVLAAQGGHNGYYGNEVYALKLGQEVPAYERIWGPTPNAQIVTTEYSPAYNPPYAGYADGAPRTSHGWYSTILDSAGRVYTTFDDANPSGTWSTGCYSLDLTNTAAGWTFHGRLWETLPGSPGSTFLYQSCPGFYDATAHKFYRCAEGAVGGPPSNGVVGVDIATMLAAGAQSTSSGPQVPGSTHYDIAYSSLQGGCSTVLHNKTPRCAAVWCPAENRIWILDLTNPSAGFTKITPTGTPPSGYSNNCFYHAASNAILFGSRELGNTIYKLSITGSNPTTATYAWSTVSVSGTAPTADAGYQGTYSKWQCIDDMGNGQSAIVMTTQVDAASYIIKLPVGGV